jgi:uncharacterized protein (DUF697 family)
MLLMFCHECGAIVPDDARLCDRCKRLAGRNPRELASSNDTFLTTILQSSNHTIPKIPEQLKKNLKRIEDTFNLIVDDPSISEDAKIRVIINLTALTCAIVAIQPIPFADFFVLTPIQLAMVITMSRVMGMPVGKHGAREVIAYVAGVVGLGLLAQQTILGLYKTVIPFAGGLTTIPLVYSATMGLGYAAKAVLDARRRDQTITKEEIKRIQEEARAKASREKTDWSPKAITDEYQKIIGGYQEYARYVEELKSNEIEALKEKLEGLAKEKDSLELKVKNLLGELQNTQAELKPMVSEDDYLKLLEKQYRIEAEARESELHKKKTEHEIAILKQQIEKSTAKAAEVIENRFRKCYPSIRVSHKNIYRKLASMKYHELHAIEVQMGRLQHDPGNARWRDAIAGTNIREIGCDGDLRLYVTWQDTGYVIEDVGDKSTQDSDIRRLKKRGIG